jgi:hypothetical protein
VALVWTNPDCPFIVRHYKENTFTNLRKHYDKEKVAILLVDSTSEAMKGGTERTKKMAEKYDLKLPVLHDTDGTVGRAYEAKRTPQVYVIDQEGKLVYNGALDNDPQGKMKAAERENYAMAAIDAALAGKTPEKQTGTKVYGCSVKYAKAQSQ